MTPSEQALSNLILVSPETGNKLTITQPPRIIDGEAVFTVGDGKETFQVSVKMREIVSAGGFVGTLSTRMSGGLNTLDYREAPSGEGPQADDWADKPHRLVYDLCGEVERLQRKIEATKDGYKVLLQWKFELLTKVTEVNHQKRTGIMDQLDAQAAVLGFEIDWKHDPRPLEDIIREEVTAKASQDVMLDLIERLREIDKEFGKLVDVLEM